MAFTYILLCSNNEYYVGSTFDLKKRLQEHYNGEGGRFTKFNRPVTLVYSEEYETISEAFRRERQLHGWSRAKKEALINGDIELLKALSTSRAMSKDTSRAKSKEKSK